MNLLAVEDIVQLISQYSPQVYCSLRLVSKEVKEMVEQVLPFQRSMTNWREKFLFAGGNCGFKLLERNEFHAWLHAMDFVFRYSDEKSGFIVENFCRAYGLSQGYIGRNVLRTLCYFNRKEYVRELWNIVVEREKLEERYGHFVPKQFLPCYFEEICMLEDLEMVKMVHEYFNHDINLGIATFATLKAMNTYRWSNVRYLIEKYPELNQDPTIEFQDDFSFAKKNWDLFEQVESCQDKDCMKELVNQNGLLLRFAKELFRRDKDIVLVAVKQNGLALKFANALLRKDIEVVTAAVKQNGSILQFVADASLFRDKKIIMEAVKSNGLALKFAHKSLQSDKDVVILAVKVAGWALEFADQSLKKDKDVVLEAVKQDGIALQFADLSMKKDKDIAVEAVKQNGWALHYADISFQKDKDVMKEAVKTDGSLFQFADQTLRKDMEVALEAVKQSQYSLSYADESIREEITKQLSLASNHQK